MATYGLGSAWSKASENQAVNQFAAASAARDRSLTDEYHRAKARENLMRLQEEGRVNMNSREANAYLENDYLRSKTNGAVGLNPAQFNQLALQNTGVADEAKAVASGLPLKNYTQGLYDVSQHATHNAAGEIQIGDKPELSANYYQLKLQAEKAALDAKNKKAGNSIDHIGYTSEKTTSIVDEALMKALTTAATHSDSAEERVANATELANKLGMDDEQSAKFIAKMYSDNKMNKADIIGYIAESGLAKNDQEYEALMDSLGVTKRKKFQIKRDGKDVVPINGFTIDGIDYGPIQTNDGNIKVVQISKLADAMNKTGGSIDDIAEENISRFASEISSFADKEDIENFNTYLMTPGVPLEKAYSTEELNNKHLAQYAENFTKLKEEVFSNGAYDILNNIQNVEGYAYPLWGAGIAKDLKSGVEKHLSEGAYLDPLPGNLGKGQMILKSVTDGLTKDLENNDVYNNAPTLVKNEIYKTEFTNRARKAILEENMKKPFFAKAHNKTKSVVTGLAQMDALPSNAKLSTGKTVVYKSLQFDPFRLKAVITDENGKKTSKMIDLRTKNKTRKSIYEFYKSLYDDNGEGQSKFMMNKLDKKGWPDGTMEEFYTKKR